MTICNFCRREILESNEIWGYHHSNFSDFETAVESGCPFCRKIAQSQDALSAWFDHDHDIKALYRWNVREAARMRETSSHICITFRPIPGRMNGERRSEDLPEYRFDLFPEEDLGFVPDKEILGPRVDCENSMIQMKSWLSECQETHPNCTSRHSGSDFLPTRLLDVGAPKEPWPPEYIRVVNTKDERVKGPYMTLSHCWGKRPFVQLTEHNAYDFTKRGISWDSADLPWDPTAIGQNICSNTNFVHALQVTRKLGIRYIWIDSICIIQGPSREDWDVEAKLMHKVYRNSYCNLAGTDSEDASGGLFRPRLFDISPTRYVSDKVSSRFRGKPWRIVPSDIWDNDLLGSHLYTRGWVFQERMLSPRLLQFGRSQVFWDCASRSACETLPGGLPDPLDTTAAIDRYWRQRLQDAAITVGLLTKSSGSSLEKFWKSAVHAYTSCNLTNFNDREPAIWGIAKLVRDALGEEYACGLWSTQIAEQLAWRVTSSGKPIEPEDSKNRFPFWSWIRMKGAILTPSRVPDHPRFYTATNHGGRRIEFQFKQLVWGWLRKDNARSWSEEVVDMKRKLDASNFRHKPRRVTPMPILEGTRTVFDEPENTTLETSIISNRTDLDKPSELLSTEILVQAHICHGILRVNGEDMTWEFFIDGVNRKQAILQAHLDNKQSEDEMPSELLLLAVSKLVVDQNGMKWEDAAGFEEEEIVDVEYSGVGILVKHVGDNRMRRVGCVIFRQLNREGWEHLRRACGQDENALRDELDVEDGEKVWLV